jgi:hypothetical protein
MACGKILLMHIEEESWENPHWKGVVRDSREGKGRERLWNSPHLYRVIRQPTLRKVHRRQQVE